MGLLIVSLQDINKQPEEGLTEEEEHDTQERRKIFIGVMSMCLGQFFHGSQGVLEEFILKRSGG